MITNTQLYLAIGVPVTAVLASLIVNLFQISGIREDIREIRNEIREIRTDIKLMTSKAIELMGQRS